MEGLNAKETGMKRLAVLVVIFVLTIAACGEADSEPTSSPGAAAGAAGERTSTAELYEPELPPTVEEFGPTATATEDDQAEEQVDGDDATASLPGDSPYPNPTATPTPRPDAPMVTPIPTVEFDEASLPELPPVPEVTSCEHAADLAIERIQLLFDALGMVPEDAMWGEAGSPDAFESFSAELEAQMDAIQTASETLGCTDEQMQALMYARIDQLSANNPIAEMLLAELQEEAARALATPTATPDDGLTATPSSTVAPLDGLQVVEAVCAACHTVAGTKAQGTVGPELTGFASRELIAGILPNTRENLRLWLADPPAAKPSTAMPNLGLSEQQIDALVVYLYSLEGSEGR